MAMKKLVFVLLAIFGGAILVLLACRALRPAANVSERSGDGEFQAGKIAEVTRSAGDAVQTLSGKSASPVSGIVVEVPIHRPKFQKTIGQVKLEIRA